MSLKVYYDLLSQPSRALVLFLKLNKVPYTDCPVALRKGEHLADAFAAINPFKKVPAIEHDGLKLSESVAILRYVANNFTVADNWYPKDARQQAKIDEYLEWQHANTRQFAAMYFQTKFLLPIMTQRPVNEKNLARYQKGLEQVLDSLETVFLKDTPYINGSKISAADLWCICELEQPKAIGYDLFGGAPRPRLADWMARVVADCEPHYGEAHKFIFRVNEKFGNVGAKL